MPIKPLDTLLAIKVINLAPDLRESDRRVGVALIDHFNRRTGRCDPSLKRIAKLLGYCERTIIRSTKKLEQAGLFRKTRHGGYSNRNSYEPNWVRLAEIENAWREKMSANAKSRRTNVSPASGQTCHVDGDSGVTQTCPDNNLPKQTCLRGHPNEARGQAEARASRIPVRFGNRSADVARTEAERRWSDALLRRFRNQPVAYGEVIEAIDETIASAATDAEMQGRGAGLAHILRQLKIPQ